MHVSRQAPPQFHSSRTEKGNVLQTRKFRAVGSSPLDPLDGESGRGGKQCNPTEEEWNGYRIDTNSTCSLGGSAHSQARTASTHHLTPAMRDDPSSEVRFPYNFRLTHSCTRPAQNTKAPNSQPGPGLLTRNKAIGQ